ncbi:MAG: DUF3806 domain-containing protein [Deltaproteobacteria bacterium]|nr:DUF3806 domain-containing protein [Deltaproteobacteria bacterium]
MGVLGRLGGLVRGGIRSALHGGSARARTGAVITDLSPEDHQRMERQRALVLAAARALFGTAGWTRSPADVAVLQRLLDEDALSDTASALPAVGVVLGDAVAGELGARWAALFDDEATVVVLHAAGKTLDLCAVVVERGARGGRVDLHAVMDEARAGLR